MTDYADLVNGLKERAEHAAQEGNMTATCDARYFSQAADAIEALVRKVEAGNEDVVSLATEVCVLKAAAEALVKERDELRDVWHKQVDVASLYFNKSQAAEAEVERLKERLAEAGWREEYRRNMTP